MSILVSSGFARVLALIFAAVAGTAPLWATEWQVARSTGDVWIVSPSTQPVSLSAQVVVRSGDKIQTGPTGRILLVRGTESILIAPNSVVSLPKDKGSQATTILHQAGSIARDLEKKEIDHFEVETPFLAAVVKGTRFEVSINRYGADVRVLDRKVSVSDHHTGQFALVSAGQLASVSASDKGGLRLEGSGPLPVVNLGAPRKSHLERVPVPAKGLRPPRMTSPGSTRAPSALHVSTARIVAPIGVGRRNFSELTKGLARGIDSSAPVRGGKGAGSNAWNTEGSDASSAIGKVEGGNGGGLGGGGGNATGKGASKGKALGKK
jgi:hypothetical protein